MGLIQNNTATNKVRNMHYDFKQKLNKIDSVQYKNLRVPEIDWKLNEAENLLIKMIANPRVSQGLGIEVTQRSIDDLRPIIVPNVKIPVSVVQRNRYIIDLPNDYFEHLSSYVDLKKNTCTVKARTTIVQHDDESEESPFDRSSFEWKDINVKIIGNQMHLITDGTFTVLYVYLDYVRLTKYFHSAEDAVGNKYTLPDKTILTGYQNCELPEILYGEIVDLAVLITTGDLLGSYEAKQAKLHLNN